MTWSHRSRPRWSGSRILDPGVGVEPLQPVAGAHEATNLAPFSLLSGLLPPSVEATSSVSSFGVSQAFRIGSSLCFGSGLDTGYPSLLDRRDGFGALGYEVKGFWMNCSIGNGMLPLSVEDRSSVSSLGVSQTFRRGSWFCSCLASDKGSLSGRIRQR